MLNVITVEVICPATSRNYDFMLPTKLKLSKLKESIVNDICSFEGSENIVRLESVSLFSNGRILDENMDLSTQGLSNGDKLIIV